MNLEKNECYTAISNRDARYDGRFVTCVLTTGIYCRPICPARTPNIGNVKFLRCAAAAEEDGFRPCKRCSPESSPGLPAWLGTSAVVRRALRMIDNGDLDNQSLETFSNRLGVSERHLRRLFVEHLGCTPVQVAKTRRLHFARKLLRETNLPTTWVAQSSGFSSVRRFHSAFRSAFEQSPTQFREKYQRKTIDKACYEMTVPVRKPYHWERLWLYLKGRKAAGFEEVTDRTYRRTFMEFGQIGVVEFAFSDEKIGAKIYHENPQVLFTVSNRTKHFLDTDSSPASVQEVLSRSKILENTLAGLPGLRVAGCWEGLELAVRAIIGQQVSVKGATTIVSRIANRFGTKIQDNRFPELIRLFPTANQLKEAGLEECGVIRTRANAIRLLAAEVANGNIQLDASANVPKTMNLLMQISGIGPWTANYIALRVLRDPDAFPASDLILRRNAAMGNQKELSEKELTDLSEQWKPYRSYAAMVLWNRKTNENT